MRQSGAPRKAAKSAGITTITGGVTSYMHSDQLGSAWVITDHIGAVEAERTYKPFGETSFETSANPAEDLGFIGERRDTDAGLIHLNARYQDPELAMFIQPDWFEVTSPGVGTNRYAYSFNDPVNLRDPGGNDIDDLPGDKSTDPEEYEVARGQEGQSVDEARTRGDWERQSERLAREVYGKSLNELNSWQRSRIGMAVLSRNNGVFALYSGPVSGAMADVGTGFSDGDSTIAMQSKTTVSNSVIGQILSRLTKSTSAVPQNARDVASYYISKGSPPPGYKGGRGFVNDGRQRGQVLPEKTTDGRSISYVELDVNPYTKGVDRGAERAVIGRDSQGNTISGWYTNDHYFSFVQMF